MDDARFDTFIKQLACKQVTRLHALRAFAGGGVAALTGMSLLGEKAVADKKGEKKKWCHRGDNFAILGKTKKLTKEEIKTHKKSTRPTIRASAARRGLFHRRKDASTAQSPPMARSASATSSWTAATLMIAVAESVSTAAAAA